MDVDRELATALAVEPSPEFAARVRAHIEHTPGLVDRIPPIVMVAGGARCWPSCSS